MDKEGFLFAKGDKEIMLLASMANRHGLIAGATGTGKTVSLKVLAEAFSDMGVPVFLADIKGDLSGLCASGINSEAIQKRIEKMNLRNIDFKGYPVHFWDIFSEKGTPIRTALSEMGPLLLSRLLNLNDTQSGILNIVFRIADDKGLLILDIKDLRAMLNYVGENNSQFTTQYGNISKQSIGAIQRALLMLEDQGGDKFFGEPGLEITDLIKQNSDGKGVINILSAVKLFSSPLLYSTFLLWLLSELYEELPEVGDLKKPKFVFFFDEAHLLFKDLSNVLLDKIEQVVRLIRSKGVGIYFITQNPSDIPNVVLGQLGNKVQHGLRAYTPKDQKGVKSAAESFRANDKFDTYKAILELGVGEALVSFLEEDGKPSIVERALVIPPNSYMGAVEEDVLNRNIEDSIFYWKYKNEIDRESAYEILSRRVLENNFYENNHEYKNGESKETKKAKPRRTTDSALEKMAKSAMSSAGREIGRTLMRGILGSLTKK